MFRILITGCSGFIGSHVAIQAKKAGHEVIATARNPSGSLERELGMAVRKLDVLDTITSTADNEAIDAIIHCATANDILSRDFRAGVDLSVCGTRNVLEYAKQLGVGRVIFISTLQVYGTELEGKIAEDTPVCCQSPYGLNHYFGEELCRMYAQVHGINVVAVRPSNIFGVPDVSTVNRESLVPMCFVKEAIQTGRITLRSSGRQRRNFISTDEVANGCLYLLEDFPAGYQIVNLGSDWLCDIREVAEMTGLIYQERYGRPLRLDILSDEPTSANRFTIDSRIAFLRPTVEESRQSMVNVITQLFNHYNLQKETIHVKN